MTVLRFWLDHVAADGGLWESSGDGALVVLPPALATRYRLPEELTVTDDPDIARGESMTFLGAGHPVLAQAAEAVLAVGDAGVLALDSGRPGPSAEVLQAEAREQVPVSHGRVDLVSAPQPATHWVLRVGALVGYDLSADDHVCEPVERWVHVASCRELPGPHADVLARAAAGAARFGAAEIPDVAHALAEADCLVSGAAVRRLAELAADVGDAQKAERRRAEAYYDDAIGGIRRRLESAPEERRVLLERRLRVTEEERVRRLAEIAEKYEARHEIRPYRLHALAVPALRLGVDVRRGERRFPLELDWLLPVGAFAQPRCPACGSVAPLVAGKANLGCLRCLAPKQRPPEKRVPRPVAPAPERPTVAPPVPPVAPLAASVPGARTSTPVSRAPRAPEPKAPPPKKAGVSLVRAENLTSALWTAVASGDARAVRRMLAPGSPAAVLVDLFGVEAVALAAGIPADVRLLRIEAGSRACGAAAVTDGLLTSSGGGHRFGLVWQPAPGGPALAEVLPCSMYADGRLEHAYWMCRLGLADLARVPRATPPDPVGRALLRYGVPWQGLAVVARALAAWQRLARPAGSDMEADVVSLFAAAVHRLVSVRAGDRGHFQTAAEAYGVPEADLRQVDTRLRKLLALGPDRPW